MAPASNAARRIRSVAARTALVVARHRGAERAELHLEAPLGGGVEAGPDVGSRSTLDERLDGVFEAKSHTARLLGEHSD